MARPKKLSDLEVAFEIVRSLRRILRKTSEHSRQLSQQSGLSIPQLLVLKAIDDDELPDELTAAKIAKTVHLSAPTVTRLIDRLEYAQYIKRLKHESDRRKVCIALTSLGKKRLESLPTPLHEEFLTKLKKLKRSEKDDLLKSLDQIVEMMQAEDIDAAPMLTPEIEVKPGRVRSQKS